MIDDSINHEYIIRYIRDVLPKSDGLLKELEDFAAANDVPVSQPETIKLIEILIRLSGAERILEIGAAIGYSAVRMAGVSGGITVDTIEIDRKAADYAEKVFERAGLSDRITLHRGNAGDILPPRRGQTL